MFYSLAVVSVPGTDWTNQLALKVRSSKALHKFPNSPNPPRVALAREIRRGGHVAH